ncbi:MAG: UDP-N-acetylmuramoyl-tripeptide--D-alanyl-D-alanine ligase [Bacteroidales bacterium]|nr:UDP-N-acetylmuramoyl-tripeptide--D-alanyl-D-alanine ligase [Bacteroidales bacterium]
MTKTYELSQIYELYLNSAGVSTDSRIIAKGSIFFALKGENFNGNDFALKSLEDGASYAVVDEDTGSDDPRVIYTHNVLETLQMLAAHHRRILEIPVVALTGSNGKTTTKELITSVLSTKYQVSSTTGNLNNHIGVPLTILKMDTSTQVAVIEMGASAPGEIELLASIAQPNIGLITNVGKAHLLGFGSFEGVKKTKGELYDYLDKSYGTALYNSDNPHLREMVASRVRLMAIPYGVSEQRVTICEPTAENPYLKMVLDSSREIKTKLIGGYNADNILAALAVGEFMGTDPELSAQAIESYTPSNNRSQLIKGKYNTLIVDAYNANPTSMRASLENFRAMRCENTGLIIGDMLELGEDSQKEHKGILEYIKEINPGLLFFVGNEFAQAAACDNYFTSKALFFKDSYELRAHLERETPLNTTILIKGSRGTRLERVLEML